MCPGHGLAKKGKTMKRFIYASVTALALVALLSIVAMAGSYAGDENHPNKTEAKQASDKAACSAADKAACSAAAKAECSAAAKAACSTATATGTASCSAHEAATKAAYADMHECCAKSVTEGKGCCGKDAKALKASFDQKVSYQKASASVKADMSEHCSAALAAGKGCCGKSADELKASYETKVKKASSKETASL